MSNHVYDGLEKGKRSDMPGRYTVKVPGKEKNRS
jgi:hypothetical protein